MRVAAFGLGLLGGLSGLALGYMATARWGLGLHVDTFHEAIVRIIGVWLMGILAVVGAFFVYRRINVAAWLYAISILGGLAFVSYFWMLPGLLLLFSEVLIFLVKYGNREHA